MQQHQTGTKHKSAEGRQLQGVQKPRRRPTSAEKAEVFEEFRFQEGLSSKPSSRMAASLNLDSSSNMTPIPRRNSSLVKVGDWR